MDYVAITARAKGFLSSRTQTGVAYPALRRAEGGRSRRAYVTSCMCVGRVVAAEIQHGL